MSRSVFCKDFPRELHLADRQTILPKTGGHPRTGFRVPEDDDQESLEDRSREASLQIIEARPHTYSVPSSESEEDDSEDDVVDMSSVRVGSQELSTPTTPSLKTSRDEEKQTDKIEGVEKTPPSLNLRSVQDLLIKGPNNGSSQQNPIDLEGEVPSAPHIEYTDSETSEDDGPEVHPIKLTEPTSADGSGLPPPPQSQVPVLDDCEANSLQATKDGVLGTQIPAPISNEDDTNVQDSCGRNKDEGPDPLTEIPRRFVRRGGEGIGLASVDQRPSIAPSSGSSTVPPFILSQSVGAIDVCRHQNDEASTHQRPPSPSDAALAKPPKNSFMAYPPPGSSGLPRIRSLAKDPGSQTSFYSDSLSLCRIDDRRDNVAKSERYNEPIWGSYFTCPQSHRDRLPTSSSDRPPWRLAEGCLGGEFEYTEGFLGDHELTPNCSPYPGHYAANTSFDPPGYQGAGYQESALAREPSSRLNISNLINDSHNSSQRRAHKRKADEMIADDKAITAVAEDTQQATAGAVAIDESQWPEAQIRDEPAIDAEDSITPDELNNSVVSSVTTAVGAKHTETQEPPRKKVKTSSSASKFGGIAKFVSGVCVGVVGALAAIIATVPASVQEEALREATNVA
ncbi:MAG: hypothetical protein Q9163_000284 [Psora crenata]